MNFLKAIKPFELITAIVDRNKPKSYKETDLPKSSTSQKSQLEMQRNGCDDKETLPKCEQNIQFLLCLQKVSSDREHCDNQIRRKISLFQRVQIQPHYLSAAEDAKLLTFEFHLGSDIFLERVQHLHEQVTEINMVIKQVLGTRKEDAIRYLDQINDLQLQVSQLIDHIRQQRKHLSQLKRHKLYRIQQMMVRKNIIKEKLRLLRNVKTKNQAAFLQITNIDQAFATEQSRTKLYKKINKLTELEKSKYVCTIKKRLVTISASNLGMVQQGIVGWASGQLSLKQIEKLAFMIYFIEKQEIYRENNLKIDFAVANKDKLKEQIRKLKEWKSFTYVKDLMTKDRIHQFLDYLLEKIK